MIGVLPYSERKEQTGRTTAPQCSAALLLQTVSRQAVATLRTLISTLTLYTDTHHVMGNSRSSLQLQPEDITAIQDETGFNQNQIERLYSR